MKSAAEFFRSLESYHPEDDVEDIAALEARDAEEFHSGFISGLRHADNLLCGIWIDLDGAPKLMVEAIWKRLQSAVRDAERNHAERFPVDSAPPAKEG